MKQTLGVINELKKKGLIEDYAIGGGIATIFYVESFVTYDLDLFVIPSKKEKIGKLIILSPIFDYLKEKGYRWQGEHIIVEGIPVQFIPTNELEEEAVRRAKKIKYEGIDTKVITPEYLISIFLRASRRKDKEKIERLLEQIKIDVKKLKDILRRYGISKKIKFS